MVILVGSALVLAGCLSMAFFFILSGRISGRLATRVINMLGDRADREVQQKRVVAKRSFATSWLIYHVAAIGMFFLEYVAPRGEQPLVVLVVVALIGLIATGFAFHGYEQLSSS